ncbi:complement C3-like [Nerophis ophidion]|uniref:complement C3-like n=1 Tax=Nerophis ophidion TaxID=159077 RepID=UPI002AE09064|nr:complement C3-like [Nerophis ophidion]
MTPLWLLASLAFTFLSSVADGVPLKLMSSPNLLRVATPENIFVECQDCTGGDMKVDIKVMNHPTKTKLLGQTSVTLNSGNNFQSFGQITIPPADFRNDPDIKQYVYLQAQFPDRLLEKVVLVSFKSGYIFIQTDKNLYTPDTTVNYRMFAVTPRMEPVERDQQSNAEAAITIEMVTPEGVILSLEAAVFLKSGMHTGSFQLPDIVSTGLWKVVAKFQSHPQQSFSAQFEVKEYVLPNFEVKLTPVVPFFYQDNEEFTVNIRATYLFGKEVDGTASVVFGILYDGQKKSFPASLQRVSVDRGVGVVTLKRAHITQTFPNVHELLGHHMFVSVSVLTRSGSEMVEAELRGIQVVTSPYTIHFKKTPKYFKPGMSFDVTVEVLNPDKSPAKDVPVVVSPGEVKGITTESGTAKLTINTVARDPKLTINAMTNDPKISQDRQTSASMEALPYNTKSNNYIHIGVDSASLTLGKNMKVNLHLSRQSNPDTDITYLIFSRGQLVQYGRYRSRGEIIISIIVTVTKDMLPSFRLIAYYHANANEVVSDSIWVEVEDSCMGSLKLEPTIPQPAYEPGKLFGLKVTGDPEATVGLVAVDKGVFVLNNKYRLTQKKVWDVVEQHDTGCTPGGGKDSMGVFYDAGLVFETNTASGTPYRLELNCPSTGSRTRRATTLLEVTTTLAGKYKGMQKDCCLDGMSETPLSYTCETRSEYITDGAECVEAFLHCCKEVESQRADMKHDTLKIARSEQQNNDLYVDNIEIITRTEFPESWLWTTVKLPTCPNQTPKCDTTSHVSSFPLQDTITTWQFTGISLSRTHGLCVSAPLEVIARKNFFIKLMLPYSAVRGEQIEIRAILHNYSPNEIQVRVDLFETEHICSAASKRRRFRREIDVGPQTTQAVPFIVIPMKEGEFGIEVKAAVRDSHLNDGIMKTLRVVSEGVLVKAPKTIVLDPTNKGKDKKQEFILNSQIPKQDMVPNSPTSTVISVIGREQVSVLVENAIAGTSMGSLIYQPTGCGEQNMIHMTLPVIATTYLDKTNQWETVGFQKRATALQHIKTGFKNQQKYRQPDGSFAVWAKGKGSSWLTAYVAKVFSMANQLVAVQRDVICDAVKFLILHAQQPDGMFREVGTVSHGEMIGDIRGGDSDASMTAFNVIAMQESRALCAETVNSLEDSENKAITYLEKRLPSLVNPYAVAMTSYALANKNKLNKEILFRFASPDLSHWPVPKGHIYTLEATAYALLALVKAQAFEDARPIVRWFNKQRKVGGGFGSTQATIMVYQAIAEYWTNVKEPDYDLKVDIQLPGRSKPIKYSINNENHYTTRTSDMKQINQDVKVIAEGTGEATLTMVSLYYALPSQKESDCQKFDLSVKLIPDIKDPEDFKLQIEVMYKDKDHDATMTVLDIGMLTGFTFNTKDLESLSTGHARNVAKYDVNSPLSKTSSLIIYLDKVSHTRMEEISFRVHKDFIVGVLQPAAVSVYEYYDQTQCVKFYHPERKGGQLLKLCRNDECTCAEENCSLQKKGQISNDLRTEKSCESTPTSKIDFVYKVRIEGFADLGSTDMYTVRVELVIKEGSTDMGAQGQLRTFLSYQHCREALDLKTDKTYLIMGTSTDIYRDEERQTFQYVLGERTWLEYWPTPAECQTMEHRVVCLGMEQLVKKYANFGCEQ